MSAVIRVGFWTGILAIVAGSVFMAPTDNLMRTVAYVLFVECPLLALVAIAINGYFSWEDSHDGE